MPGLFSRAKNWVKEHLKATDLNAEFDNVISNSIPTKIDDLSSTVSDMQETDDPGTEGVESQATSFEEEIKHGKAIVIVHTANENKAIVAKAALSVSGATIKAA